MIATKLLLTVSLFLLTALIPASWSSPVDKRDAGLTPPISQKPNKLVQRVVTQNTCSALYIQAAESRANKGPHQTISSLCSSLLSKYKTVTHSVYTKTVTPRTTIDEATTAPGRVITATNTAEITQQSTDIEGSTSVTDVTAVHTETSVVETDIVTVTAPAPVDRRKVYPCQEIESILTLSAGSATPFCSCYIPSSTSTKTVTCDGATTATPVHVTDYTKTITPIPSTVYTTVVKTTEVITTVESETVVTSTVSADTTISVTDIVTSTVSPQVALSSGYIQIQNPASPYDQFYAYINEPAETVLRVIEFIPDLSSAVTFSVNSSNNLNTEDGAFAAAQDSYQYTDNSRDNILYTIPTVDYFDFAGRANGPTCSVLPTSQLTCTDAPTDIRTVLSICPHAGTTFDDEFGTTDLPFLVLDAAVDDGCELALLFFIPG